MKLPISEYNKVVEIHNLLEPFVHGPCIDDKICTMCGISTICEKAIDLFQETLKIMKEENQQ